MGRERKRERERGGKRRGREERGVDIARDTNWEREREREVGERRGGDWEWMAWAFETSQPVPNDTRAQLLILPQIVSLTGEQLFKHVNPGGSGDGVGCGSFSFNQPHLFFCRSMNHFFIHSNKVCIDLLLSKRHCAKC